MVPKYKPKVRCWEAFHVHDSVNDVILQLNSRVRRLVATSNFSSSDCWSSKFNLWQATRSPPIRKIVIHLFSTPKQKRCFTTEKVKQQNVIELWRKLKHVRMVPSATLLGWRKRKKPFLTGLEVNKHLCYSFIFYWCTVC